MNPAQLLIVDLPGPELDPLTRDHLARHRFGGVCLFRKNIQNRAQVARLVRDLKDLLGEIWIAIDHEGGAVWRIDDLPRAPAAMALGALDDEERAHSVGRAVARGLISLGINWDLAPVLDVNTNPENPVIAERSFSSSPEQVARLGLAFARGLEAEGVMSSVKHFPGHGNTWVDSHLDLPVVEDPPEALEAHLFPFRRAVEAQVGSVMTAHILYPQLDPALPATLSPTILKKLLRQTWGYSGLIVTDSLAMKAISARYSPREATQRALEAGADLVLALGSIKNQEEAARGLSELPSQLLEEHLARSRLALQRFPGTPRAYTEEEEQRDRALMKEVAFQAITALGQPAIPQPEERLLLLSSGAEAGLPGVYEGHPGVNRLAQALRPSFPRLQVALYRREDPQLPPLDGIDRILLATLAHGPLHPQEVHMARVLAQMRPVLHLALWNPYHARALGLPALISYGFHPEAIEGLVNVLRGAPPQGRLPVAF
jgi:beta-N-acetylhexosaminidase